MSDDEEARARLHREQTRRREQFRRTTLLPALRAPREPALRVKAAWDAKVKANRERRG